MRAPGQIMLLGWTLALVPACAGAPPGTQMPPDSAILRVGVSPQSPPMVFKQGGQIVGAEPELAQALAGAMGRRLVFVEQRWEDLIDALCEERIDIIMSSMSITPARRYRIAFTNPYLQVGQLALTRGGEKYSYLLNLATQAKHGVGVKKGTTADFLMRQEFPHLARKYYKTGEDAATALVKKKIDLFISDAPMIWHLAGLHETEGLTVMPLVLSQEQLGWGVRRADTQLLDSANAFLAKAQESGELKRILSRWMPGFR